MLERPKGAEAMLLGLSLGLPRNHLKLQPVHDMAGGVLG